MPLNLSHQPTTPHATAMHPTPHAPAAEPHSHLSYSYPPDLPADYNEAEAAQLEALVRATHTPGVPYDVTLTAWVVKGYPAVNYTEEAPTVLARLNAPVVMHARRGEGTNCTPA